MSNKMNYGKRFNGRSWVGGPVGYDREMDRSTWGGLFKPAQKGSLRLAFNVGKTQSSSKASKARVGKLPNGDPPPPKIKSRTEYEKEFGAMITEVATRLEHGLEELNMAPPLKTNEAALINRRQVIEAIHRLKRSFYRVGCGMGSTGGKYK